MTPPVAGFYAAADKAITALSPLQYQKHVRLLHARSLLIAREGHATSIAFGVGYESPNQFSREYARQVGLAPARDAARLRRKDPRHSECMSAVATGQVIAT
jgi:AraC-like DNA-binding protein